MALILTWDLESEVPAVDADALHLYWSILEDLPDFDPTPIETEVDDVPIKAAISTSATAAQNQTAIHAAIDQAKSQTRGAVYLPSGEYSVQCPISKQVANLRLYGDGMDVTVLKMVRNNAPPVTESIRLLGNSVTVEDFSVVENTPLGTRGAHNTYPGMTGLRIGGAPGANANTYCDQVVVRGMKFSQTIGQAIIAYYTKRVAIVGNIVENVGEGIAVENCTNDVIVANNLVKDTSDDQIIVKCASDGGKAPGPTQRAVIANNICIQGDAKGIIVLGTEHAVVSGNVTRDHNQFGIAVFQDPGFADLLPPKRVEVIGNVVHRPGQWYGNDASKYLYTAPNAATCGIHCNATYASISDNQVYDSVGSAIECDGASSFTDVAIAGNKIAGAGKAGISCGNPDNLTFKHSNVRVQNNDVERTVGGITLGELDIFACIGNVVHSYRNGASGARRGILVGHSQRGQITGNTVVNDDGGAEQILAYNGCLNVTTTPNVTL